MFVWSISDIEIGLPYVRRAVIALAIGMGVTAIEAKLQGPCGFFNYVVGRVQTVRSANLLRVKFPARPKWRTFRHKIDCRRRLGSVKQTASAADKLNLTHRLRERQVIQRRKTNPITR